MPSLEQGVAGDEDRKVGMPEAVEHLRERVSTEAFADDKSVTLKHREFLGIESGIKIAVARLVRFLVLVYYVRIGVEQVPSIGRWWDPMRSLQDRSPRGGTGSRIDRG